MTDPLHSIGFHANHLSRHTNNERMQAILQWVGVGSVIMMGAAATVHLIRDLMKPHTEPFCRHKYRETMERVNDNADRGERERGR